MVLGGEVSAILTGKGSLVLLRLNGSITPLARSLFLHRCWAGRDAASSTVVADAVHIDVTYIGVVDVGVVNDSAVNMHDRSVVAEFITPPSTAVETVTGIAVSVVHAAVKADLGAPVSGVPEVAVTTPAPVAWGPEQTDGGGHDPGSGHPVVIAVVGVPCPVAGGPYIVGTRTDRLLVDGQFGRRYVDRYSHCNLRKGHAGQHK